MKQTCACCRVSGHAAHHHEIAALISQTSAILTGRSGACSPARVGLKTTSKKRRHGFSMPFPAPFRLPALCKSCSKVSSQPFCSHVPNPTNRFSRILAHCRIGWNRRRAGETKSSTAQKNEPAEVGRLTTLPNICTAEILLCSTRLLGEGTGSVTCNSCPAVARNFPACCSAALALGEIL
jgi:hypothetical protein